MDAMVRALIVSRCVHRYMPLLGFVLLTKYQAPARVVVLPLRRLIRPTNKSHVK